MAADPQDEDRTETPPGGEEAAQKVEEIAACVRDEAAHQDETTPDGLAYHVDTFELEVERFLEVDSWNELHGIEETDQVEEKLVQEMKEVQVEGDKRRELIKQGFQAEETQLGHMEDKLKDLVSRIDSTKSEAEKAARADIDQTSISEDAGKVGEQGKGLTKKPPNPFSEYKEQIQLLEGKAAAAREDVPQLKVDDSGARTRIEKLRAETALLRQCMQAGPKGNFASYSTTVAGK